LHYSFAYDKSVANACFKLGFKFTAFSCIDISLTESGLFRVVFHHFLLSNFVVVLLAAKDWNIPDKH